MKKMLCLVTLLCLTAFPALAEQVSDALAPACSDSSAQLLSQETEDGLKKTTYWLPRSNEILEHYYDSTLNQVILDKFELQGDEGGSSIVLTETEAQAKVLEVYPDASIAYTKCEIDDRRYHYEIVFTTAGVCRRHGGERRHRYADEAGTLLRYPGGPLPSVRPGGHPGPMARQQGSPSYPWTWTTAGWSMTARRL